MLALPERDEGVGARKLGVGVDSSEMLDATMPRGVGVLAGDRD